MRTFSSTLRAGLLGLLVVTAAAAPALAGPKAGTARPLSGKDLYRQTLPGVVLVATDNGHGSGWVVDRDRRLIVTNFHVVASGGMTPASTVRVVFPAYKGKELIAEASFYDANFESLAVQGEVIASDPQRDLAVVEVASLPAGEQALALAAEEPSPGESVATIGNPGPSQARWVFNQGAVRQVYRAEYGENGQFIAARVVETQNPLNHGDSGGPLVNEAGEVVGVNDWVEGEGASLVSRCISVAEVKDYLKELQPLLNPTTAEDFTALGERRQKAKRWDKAVTAYTTALKLKPRNVKALDGRSWVYNEIGQFDKALADCDAALKVDRNDAAALKERGYANLKLGRLAPAVADCDRVLKTAPDDSGALFYRGQAYAGLGRADEAMADYVRSAAAAGEDDDAWEAKVFAKVQELAALQPPATDDGD
jgi:tetratricopeptide (TPR) repeat protein